MGSYIAGTAYERENRPSLTGRGSHLAQLAISPAITLAPAPPGSDVPQEACPWLVPSPGDAGQPRPFPLREIASDCVPIRPIRISRHNGTLSDAGPELEVNGKVGKRRTHAAAADTITTGDSWRFQARIGDFAGFGSRQDATGNRQGSPGSATMCDYVRLSAILCNYVQFRGRQGRCVTERNRLAYGLGGQGRYCAPHRTANREGKVGFCPTRPTDIASALSGSAAQSTAEPHTPVAQSQTGLHRFYSSPLKR